MKRLKLYISNNLLAFDRLLNAMAGGDSRETISSRIGRNNKSSFLAIWLYKFLNWLEDDHCEKSIENEHKDIGNKNVF